ncbi:MAG: ribonuclease Z [Actinobacteria bacterium]|nr:ribonuclease Z [Actinomycetota bacterium]
MDLSLTFLGTAASVPTAVRGTAATLITRGGHRFLVDCGEGTQRQLLRSGIGLVDLDAVFITHLHADHILGIPGLLKTYALRGRDTPLALVGPRGFQRLLDELQPVIGRLTYAVEVMEVGPGGAAWRDQGARIEAFETSHGVTSVGYALIEDDRPGAFDVAVARDLGVPEGPLFGELQRGNPVTVDGRTVTSEQVLGEPRHGRLVVLTGDTEPCAATVQAAAGATVLVHEATFTAVDRERAAETHHSTAAEAAQVAATAGVGLLALTHISSRVMPREVRDEARAVFPNTITPRDFDRLEIPYPERGAVVHHRAPRNGPPAEPAPPDIVSGAADSLPGDRRL